MHHSDINCRVAVEVAIRMLLVEKGYLRQILLSHDVCTKSHLRTYGGQGYDYVLTGFVPRLLAAGLSTEQIAMLLVDNPRAALTGEAS